MYKRFLLIILVGSFSVGPAMAQQPLSVPGNKVAISNTDKGKIYYANQNEPPRAIAFNDRAVTIANFLANINLYLDVPTEFTFVEVESNTDDLGMRHRQLQQYYKGIPLEGLTYRVHERHGFVTSANGRAIRNIKVDTQTTLSEEHAFHLAVNYLNAKDSVFKKGKRLIVSKKFAFTPESFAMAFQFDIDVSFIEQWRISIDARNGQVLNKVSLVNTCGTEEKPTPWLPYGTGRGLTNYYGNQNIRVEEMGNGSSRLLGKTENGGMIGTYDFRNVSILSLTIFFQWHEVYDFYSPNRTYNDPYQRPAVSVQWAAEQAYEYYFREHNRNSFDDQGTAITSYVHIDQNLNNAFWVHNLLAFGDGNNNNPLVELDVVSHELTHGVTQYEANLQYYNESGALNESFSDILGKAVEFDVFGDTATWQLAKHYGAGGLRDLSNPNLKNQPDTYAGDLWYTGYDDYGGVHTNSGVQNFWFYLLCQGGSGVNDHQSSYSVNPVGMKVAAKIAYRNLSEYLTSSSDYLDSRIGSLLSAADLYGSNSAVYQEVDKAWDAVGVIDEPIITGIEVYDITATTVKIKGTLLPRGDAVTYHFEYGPTPALGSTSPTYNFTTTVGGTLTGLQSETKYYLRLVATNENGSTPLTTEFTTISLAPLVKVKQTVDVTETTAIMYGEVNPNSLPTAFYFEYGTTPALGLVTPSYSLSAATEFQQISADVVGLQPRQTYYYRLKATNGFSTSVTESMSFFTAAKPVILSFTPKVAPVGAEITVSGENFSPTAERNIVMFGAVRAPVLSSTSAEIKVKVPPGASLGTISLLDSESGLTAESIQEFVPTYTGEFKENSLQLSVGIDNMYIYQALVQDMDGDNKPDVVARHYLGFSVLQNVNQGGDITDQSFVRNTFNLSDTPGPISLVDFDGNGLKDVVGSFQDGLRIWPNFSVPGYPFFGTPVDFPVAGSLRDVVFSDFDMDGHIDIAGTTIESGGRQLIVIRNQSKPGSLSTNTFEQRYAQNMPYEVFSLATRDLNNDGAPDLLVGAYGHDFLSILRNTGHPGSFAFEEKRVQDLTRGRFVRYAASDLNGDGWTDVISSSPHEIGSVAILENKKTAPDISVTAPVLALGGYVESALQDGDINGDGKVDLLVGTNKREVVILKNTGSVGEPLSGPSFEKFGAFGMTLEGQGSGTVEVQMTVNDLNGDGRPEVINAYSYNYGPHDGYQFEIWQNAPNKCLDPSLVTIEVSYYSATIVLPPNTTLDQFEIDYTPLGNSYWSRVTSRNLYVSPGDKYQLRVRAKCYLGFTGYHYLEFATDCVDIGSFSIHSVGVDNVTFSASYLPYFEVEYSRAGEADWQALPQYSTQVTDLSPGTKYDVRFRGRCYSPADFQYTQFTTRCPELSSIRVNDVDYNRATATWTANYPGDAMLDYSVDNVSWMPIDETLTMFPLIPGKQYFVRGRMACTDVSSDFVYTTFTTTCPKVSALSVDAVTPTSATVVWADETDASSFVLTYRLAAGGTATAVETSATSLKLDGLIPGAPYIVTVAPQCTGGKNFVSFMFNTICYAPFDLAVNAITYTTAELTWNDNYSVLPYSVDYSILGTNVWITTETPLTRFTLTNLRPGTTYEARVHINCISETARYISVHFETSLYDETTFGPNPTEDIVTLRPSKDLIGNRFMISDSMGRVIRSGELLDYVVDFSDFSAGVYTVRIEGETAIRIVKR